MSDWESGLFTKATLDNQRSIARKLLLAEDDKAMHEPMDFMGQGEHFGGLKDDSLARSLRNHGVFRLPSFACSPCIRSSNWGSPSTSINRHSAEQVASGKGNIGTCGLLFSDSLNTLTYENRPAT